MTTDLFEVKVRDRQALTRQEAEQVLAAPDLVGIGRLGEAARRALSGDFVTYGRVAIVEASSASDGFGEAGEVRVVGRSNRPSDVRGEIRQLVGQAGGLPVTAWSLHTLVEHARGAAGGLQRIARELHEDGVAAVADVAVDMFPDIGTLIAAARTVSDAGLGVWRVTVEQPSDLAQRLTWIDRVAALQAALGSIRAFAPLPRQEPPNTPSTGYDDVRTVAAARLRLPEIPAIQVDWITHGPKLAQVAIAFGANDVDGIAPVDVLQLGQRRSPKADIERQIRAAAARPVERDGRYERRA
jgi:hypothetical protein